jgi:hypothetical protein
MESCKQNKTGWVGGKYLSVPREYKLPMMVSPVEQRRSYIAGHIIYSNKHKRLDTMSKHANKKKFGFQLEAVNCSLPNTLFVVVAFSVHP